MSTLIVGGTSGLGLAMAKELALGGERVSITGRYDPQVEFADFYHFDLTSGRLPARIGQFVAGLAPVSSLIYAAGFYQDGLVTDLSDDEVDDMIDVGERGLIFFTKKLLEKQGQLDELVTVTSTSQWTPRQREPIYCAAKAGAAHYSHALSLDQSVGKTLVVGTSGMDTGFWRATDRDTSGLLQPEWVAEQIMALRKRDDAYTFVKILGAHGDLPDRVEIVDSRP